jgi:RNA polymerase sigma-70 factor (ECF subfamily)
MADREEGWAVAMRAALGGDQAVYERLLRDLAAALGPRIRQRCHHLGVAPAESEDILQETLLAVHLKRHTWKTDQPIGPWLRAIAHNKLIDAMRRRGRRVHLPIEDFADILPAEPERPGTDSQEVTKHLAQLPERQQAVLQAIAVDGASIGETAQRMKMTPGAVRVALHRGFASLAARLRSSE